MYIYSSIISFLDSTREAVHGVGARAGWRWDICSHGHHRESKGERMVSNGVVIAP